MKSRKEEQKSAKVQSQAKMPRFKIERLDERIAPRGCSFHYNPHGKPVGHYGRFCGRYR